MAACLPKDGAASSAVFGRLAGAGAARAAAERYGSGGGKQKVGFKRGWPG